MEVLKGGHVVEVDVEFTWLEGGDWFPSESRGPKVLIHVGDVHYSVLWGVEDGLEAGMWDHTSHKWVDVELDPVDQARVFEMMMSIETSLDPQLPTPDVGAVPKLFGREVDFDMMTRVMSWNSWRYEDVPGEKFKRRQVFGPPLFVLNDVPGPTGWEHVV